MVWSERIRIYESGDRKSTVRKTPSKASGMEPIPEVEEDCFSTNKTLEKSEMLNEACFYKDKSQQRSTTSPKREVKISDFENADDENKSDKHNRRLPEPVKCTDTVKPTASLVATASISFAAENPDVEFCNETINLSNKVFKKKTHHPTVPKSSLTGSRSKLNDKAAYVPRNSPNHLICSDLKFSSKSSLHSLENKKILPKSSSNFDFDSTHSNICPRNTDVKTSKSTRRFFKSFRDILQKKPFSKNCTVSKSFCSSENVADDKVHCDSEKYESKIDNDVAEDSPVKNELSEAKEKSFFKIKGALL